MAAYSGIGSLPDAAQRALIDYYRCPSQFARVATSSNLATNERFFDFVGHRCFGRTAPEIGIATSGDTLVLPFDLDAVATNLRRERYVDRQDERLNGVSTARITEQLYYLARPLMPVAFRRHLQRIRLRGWDAIDFPRWPVDSTVDDLMEQTLRLLIADRGEKVPFIWFWPDGAACCTMLTHDVEGRAGLEFCEALMDLDERFGTKAAFQLIPEGAHDSWQHAAAIRARGFEVNLHDLNHDGRLFGDRHRFERRARRINEYSRERGCKGFRSGAMYRQQDWYQSFDFEYDMSVPNVAHLEPQRGGCCTVMPYFVGNVLELPLTTAQDYSLFFILEEYSTRLWRDQIATIQAKHGLISIITHPDYLIGGRERAVFTELLEHLARMRDEGRTWSALPGDVNRWWRQRREMTLEPCGSSWRVVGAGSEHAVVAYAHLDEDRVVYSVGQQS